MLGLREQSLMAQFAGSFWHLKNLPSFKNCGQPVKREQHFGIWTEDLTCQLGCPECIVSETRGNTGRKNRLCSIGTVLMSTAAPNGREGGQLCLPHFSGTSLPQPPAGRACLRPLNTPLSETLTHEHHSHAITHCMQSL